MNAILSIYSSKKLTPLLGKNFHKTTPKVVAEKINPLYCWYGDIYYLDRKKYLIFCNAKTRVIFMIGPYQVDNKIHFMNIFHDQLKKHLSKFFADTENYFEKVEDIGYLEKPDKGATAFLNRVKEDLNYSKAYRKSEGNQMKLPEDFEIMFERYPTSIKGKIFFPEDRFIEVWENLK